MNVNVSFMTRPPFLRGMECTLSIESEAALLSELAWALWRRCNSLAPAVTPATTCPPVLTYCLCSQSYPGSPRKWRLRIKECLSPPLKKYHFSPLGRSRLLPHTAFSVYHLFFFYLTYSTVDSLHQWWANYGPRVRCGPLRGSVRPAADFKIVY